MSASRPEIELPPLVSSTEIDNFLAGEDRRRRQREADLQQRLEAGVLICPRCEHGLIADPHGIDGPLLFCPDLSGCGFREP